MSFKSAIHLIKTMESNAKHVDQIMYSRAAELASHNRMKNVAVVVNKKPHGAEVVFKPMVGATVKTESMAKNAKALAAKLASESKIIGKDVVK